MMDRLLRIHLEPVARQRRRLRLFRALTRCWLAAGGIGVAFLLVRLTNGWSSPWVFLLLGAGTLIATLMQWRRQRRIGDEYQALAREIECDHPELHAVLLTAVEQHPDSATGRLNHLQDRVIREALTLDRGRLWNADAQRHLLLARAAAFAALLLAGGALLSLYRVAPPGPALVALIEGGMTISPGDTSVEKGSSLVVLARFNGRVPAEASLIVRPANEPEQRIPLAKNLDDPVFGGRLHSVNDELTYRVEHDGQRTREFRVTVFEHPRLERADAKVTFPEYTGLPSKTIDDTRRVSAVEGSEIAYTFHLNKPVKSATLVSVGSRRGSEPEKTGATANPPPHVGGYELVADTNRPNVYVSNFKLEDSGRYELLLVDDAGRTNKLPPHFVFVALTNRLPELKFIAPRGDQRVSALEEMAFRIEASDDFGLKRFGLAYNLAGQEPRFVELGQTADPHEKRAAEFLLAIENLDAVPDQLLSYHLWAEDIGRDGEVRRSFGEMMFAEIRPFEEIFREGQAQDPNAQQQSGEGQNAAERLAQLQKQIISATWNLQRREIRETPSAGFRDDVTVVQQSQENALEQLRAQSGRSEDPRITALVDAAGTHMERAARQLGSAAGDNSLKPLPPALASEQAAYQALLQLAEREFQVARAQNRQGGQGSRSARGQRQLDQLDLRQSENRYETQRLAAPPQSPQQREQLQMFNRLKELAQRQQDVNERLRELQAALQAARTEAEREELRRQLKRLEEEQQQMLADLDELRQRMERPESQSQTADARQQLEQTREDVQRASEAMQRGDTSQALASGTRAQRDLQQMRDDFRRENSSQFAEDMRELRSQARELAQQQEQIGQQLDALNDPTQRQTLTDTEERQALASQLDEQKQRLDDLLRHASEVTTQAEPVEPLLARQLYESVRKAAQDDARNLQNTGDDLLSEGRLSRNVQEQLRRGQQDSRRAVEVAAELLRTGYSAEANNLEERARRSINELRSGVERAAESVLGDDTEALRLARSELDELSRQLERELAQAQRQSNTNGAGGRQGNESERLAAGSSTNLPPEVDGYEQGRQQTQNQSRQGGQQGDQPEGLGRQGQQAQSQQPGQNNQPGEGEEGRQPGQRGQGQGERQVASANQQRGGNSPGQAEDGQPGRREGNRQSGGRGAGDDFLERLGGEDGNAFVGGPITGAEFTQWSDRLRDVEEMLDVPELRAEAARIRDRARAVRQDLRRHSLEPQWDLVRVDIAGPLLELRTRVSEELARRESTEALVPIDRDPVPRRYAELVRRYYEELGRSETKPDSGGVR